MKKTIVVLIVAGLLLATPAWGPSRNAAIAQLTAGYKGPLPPKWDPRIPLPEGVTLLSSTTPKTGVVYSAEFLAPRTYKDLVDFYETELPKSGFKMESKVAIPARKVYNRTFGDQGILDSIVISPRPNDPSLLTLHITYTPASSSSSKKQ